MEPKLLKQSEERTIYYEDNSQIQDIVSELSQEDFLLVKHSTRTKQLIFKKILVEPETIIISDPQ